MHNGYLVITGETNAQLSFSRLMVWGCCGALGSVISIRHTQIALLCSTIPAPGRFVMQGSSIWVVLSIPVLIHWLVILPCQGCCKLCFALCVRVYEISSKSYWASLRKSVVVTKLLRCMHKCVMHWLILMVKSKQQCKVFIEPHPQIYQWSPHALFTAINLNRMWLRNKHLYICTYGYIA